MPCRVYRDNPEWKNGAFAFEEPSEGPADIAVSDEGESQTFYCNLREATSFSTFFNSTVKCAGLSSLSRKMM